MPAWYFSSAHTAPVSFINNNQISTMSFIDHKAKTTKAEIDALLAELENPSIALLNKRVAELDSIQDAGDIVRIHNGIVKAVEDLNARVSRIESHLGLNAITK